MGTGTAGLFPLCWNLLCIWIPCGCILDQCFGDNILYECWVLKAFRKTVESNSYLNSSAAANKLPTLGPKLPGGTCCEMSGKESRFGTEPVFSLHGWEGLWTCLGYCNHAKCGSLYCCPTSSPCKPATILLPINLSEHMVANPVQNACSWSRYHLGPVGPYSYYWGSAIRILSSSLPRN